MRKFNINVMQRTMRTEQDKIEVRTKQAPSTNYEYSHREKFKSLKNIIVK